MLFLCRTFLFVFLFGGGRKFSSAAILNNLDTPHNLNTWSGLQTNINFITLHTLLCFIIIVSTIFIYTFQLYTLSCNDVEAFKPRYVLAYESSRIAVYSTWCYHVKAMFFCKGFWQPESLMRLRSTKGNKFVFLIGEKWGFNRGESRISQKEIR